jgi:hypothetical protein
MTHAAVEHTTTEELIEEVKDGVFFQEMRELAADVKRLAEYVRHIDVKLDMLQDDIDELGKSLRLNERLTEVERALKVQSYP